MKTNSTKTWIAALLLCAMTACPLLGQEKKEATSPEFEKAKLVEEVEGDLTLAMDLYSAIVNNQSNTQPLRNRALLARAVVLCRLGRKVEAEKELAALIKSGAPEADDAKRILTSEYSGIETRWDLRTRIRNSLAKLRVKETSEEGQRELMLIGRAAVEAISEMARHERNDLGLLERLCETMMLLDRNACAEWIGLVVKDDDIQYKRSFMAAMVEAVANAKSGPFAKRKFRDDRTVTDVLAKTCKGFFATSDPILVTLALTLIKGSEVRLSGQEIIDLLTIRDGYRSATLFEILGSYRIAHWTRLGQDAQFLSRVHPILLKLFVEKDTVTRRQIAQISMNLMRGKRASLDHLFDLMKVSTISDFKFPLWKFYPSKIFTEDISASHVLKALSELPEDYWVGPKNLIRQNSPRHMLPKYQQQYFVSKVLWQSALTSWRNWNNDDLMALLETGCWPFEENAAMFSSRLASNQVPWMIQNIECFGLDLVAKVTQKTGYRGAKFGEYLAPFIRKQLRQSVSSPEAYKQTALYRARFGRISEVIEYVCQDSSKASVKELRSLIEEFPTIYPVVATMLSESRVSNLPAIRSMAGLHVEGDYGASGRAVLFMALARYGGDEDLPLFISMATQGVLNSYRPFRERSNIKFSVNDDPFKSTKLQTLAFSRLSDRAYQDFFGQFIAKKPVGWLKELNAGYESGSNGHQLHIRFSSDLHLQCFEALWENRSALSVSHWDRAIRSQEDDHIRHACLSKVFGSGSMNEFERGIRAMKVKDAPNFREVLVKGIESDNLNVVSYCCIVVGLNNDVSFLPLLEKRARKSMNSNLSVQFLIAILKLQGPTPDELFKLAMTKMSPSSKIQLCQTLGQFRSKEVIPLLLLALKDNSGNVQKAARSELERVRFYLETEAYWNKIFEGTALESNTAAEALIKQSAVGQDKAQRLLAIKSLVSLAVPESLPILIQYSTETDPEIKAAAKESIAIINKKFANK